MLVRSAGTPGSRPSTRTCPREGGSAVASSRSRVVLPAPLGPSNPITPGSRSRSTPASARVAPNMRPTPRRLIEAVTIVYLHGRSWRSQRRRTRKTTNEAAASARKPAWARAWSTASGEPDRAASSQTTASQAELTAMG